jgi:archaellum component FlaG (FlaF/FlaG flagellin family)
MKKKLFIPLFIINLFCGAAFAQTIKDKVNRAAKDSSRAANAAKADVYVQKKTIADPNQIKITAVTAGKKNAAENKRKVTGANKVKYKRHKFKSKKRSSSK